MGEKITIFSRFWALMETKEEWQAREKSNDHQLAKIPLPQYSKELERSNQDLEDFAHIASHDLQAPLRKVITFGDRLKEGYSDKLGERGHDFLERMEKSTPLMQKFINDLLEYSRVNAGPQKFNSINLNETAKGEGSTFTITLAEKQPEN